MQVFGSIKDEGGDFYFETRVDSERNCTNSENYSFSNKRIFVYIDGAISKLSKKIDELTDGHDAIEEKVAYLYSINFNFESHICGSFNIFLFDFNARELKIIRDSRGTRSLFYVNNENEFIFSSDQSILIKKIRNLTLNKKKLVEFLNWDYFSNNETYFNEIFRLEPHHFLIYRNNALASERYTFSEILFKESLNTDIHESFKKLFYHSVTSLTRKDKKVGVMLSGGLDSSAVAIALKENNYDEVFTYSANFHHVDDNNYMHESKYQENISNITSYQHTPIQMEEKSPIKPIKKFTKILNQPIQFPNIYLFEQITNKLLDDGIEIILDGNDGDNTVSHGFEVLFLYFKNLKLIKFIKEIYLYSKFKKSSFIRLLVVLIKQALRDILNIKVSQSGTTLLKENLVIKKNPKNNISYFSSHKKKLSIDLHFLGNEYRNSFFRFYGIENFSPFYDEELIDFCINMPSKHKLNEGNTRKILRDFLSDYLPKDHVKRDKSILTSGLLKNFSCNDLQIIKDEYASLNSSLSHLLETSKIESIIKNLESGKQIKEEEILNLQVFMSANTFMNEFNF